MGELFKGKTEYLVLLAIVAMACLVALVLHGDLTVRDIAVAAVTLPSTLAAWTAAARATRVDKRVDDLLSPADKKTDPAVPTPPPLAGGKVPFWLFPIFMSLMLVGCVSKDIRASAVALNTDFKVYRAAVVANPKYGPEGVSRVAALGLAIEGHLAKLEEVTR